MQTLRRRRTSNSKIREKGDEDKFAHERDRTEVDEASPGSSGSWWKID